MQGEGGLRDFQGKRRVDHSTTEFKGRNIEN